MNGDIDIRPVNVDRLTTFEVHALTVRRQRIEELLAMHNEEGDQLRKALEANEALFRFLQNEHDAVVLAQQLKQGDVVRVVCPVCRGGGLKPVNVTSGRVQRKSAFETHGPVAEPVAAPEGEKCDACQGKRWQLMERFKG